MIWSLQTLRFVAALMVVYTHAAQTAYTATGSYGLLPHEFQIAGRAGVDIFFILSGVVIAKTAPGLSWQEFAWKRFRRIIPLYYLVLVPALLIVVRTGFGWREFLATFILWPATDVMTVPLLPVAWTLCFEMLFYTAAALVLAERRWLWVLLGLYALAVALRPLGPIFQFLGNPLVIEFLLGVGIARLLPAYSVAIWGLPVGFLVIVTAGFLGVAPRGGDLEFLVGEQGFQRVTVYGIPAALIVYGTIQIKTGQSVWTHLGDSSFTLYLTHTIPVTGLLALWMVYPIDPDLIIVIGTSASVLLAWRLYERVERPILTALGRVNIRRSRPSPAC